MVLKVIIGILAVVGLIAVLLIGSAALRFQSGPAPLAGALAALPSLRVDSLTSDSTHHRAVVRITNDVAREGYSVIGIQCAWLNKGVAVQANGTVATSVGYQQTVYETVLGPYRDTPIDDVRCRVEYANKAR